MSNDVTHVFRRPTVGVSDDTVVLGRLPKHASETMPNTKRPRVMVLGGTSGIGAACAKLAERVGMETMAVGREDFDIRDFSRLRKELVDWMPTHLVYSVGVNILDWTQHINHSTIRDLFDINTLSFIDVMQVLMDMHDRVDFGWRPSVVAVSSDAARRPMRTSAVYCATKAALDMLIKVMARERAGTGWRINAVAPGKVSGTRMTAYVDQRVLELRGWSKEYADAYEASSSALGRAATPDEVAQVVMDVLFGPPSLNGAIIDVNGGR